MNRNVLITGAGRGVGRACALAFAREGDSVALVARTKSELDAAAAECLKAGAKRAIAVAADLTNRAAVDSAVANATKELGGIDVLCHAAGGAKTAAFDKTDDALWSEMLMLNLTSAFYISRAVLTGMTSKKRGRIIYIGSTASRTGYRYCSAYVASKHGLLGMARSLAAEVAGGGVTVNVVGPGFLDVDATHKAAAEVAARSGKSTESVLDTYKNFSPQKRLVPPEEVAATVLFLASDAAAGVNGQCLLIDGGGIVS